MADGALPPDVADSLGGMEDALEALEAHSQSFFSTPLRGLDTHLQPLERARLHMTVSHAVNALFAAVLATRGVSLDEHPANRELDRLRLYTEKVERAARSKAPAPSPGVLLDVQAAGRFIQNAIPDLTPEQRRRVREVGQQHKRRKKDNEKKSSRDVPHSSKQSSTRPNVTDEAEAFLALTREELLGKGGGAKGGKA